MPLFSARSGDTLWYQDQGRGPALLFIHGWCMSGEVWKYQRDALSGTYRLITIDLPGHGRSGGARDGFTVSGCADLLSELLNELELEQTVVVGWSLGAFVAAELFLNHRNCVAALVLVGPTPRFVQSDDFPYGLSPKEAQGMAVKVQRNIQRALGGFQALMLAPNETAAVGYDELVESLILPTVAVALQALQALVDADLRDTLSQITCPVLVIHGDHDRICLPQASEYLAAHIPDCRRMVFPGCGHIPFVTQTGRFNECLDEFMGRVRGVADR